MAESSPPSLSTINELLKNFAEYVPKHIISATPMHDELSITYEYVIYDLIDRDLDFDESYYDKLIINFNRVFLEECKSLTKSGLYSNIKLVVSKKLMQGESKTEVIHHIDGSCNRSISYH